jgi:sugar phosphate isomerase/epimerase
MFALSTAWNADKYQDGDKIAREIHSLGIRKLELNFSLTSKMVEEIFNFTRQNSVVITSLHNYCPIPEGMTRKNALPDCFSLSSMDEKERKKALEYTKITISTAKRLKARAVVLHCGRVEITDHTRELIAIYNQGLGKSEQYRQLFDSFVKERKAKSPDYLGQTLKSLEVLSGFARKLNIFLSVENRFYYREIPSYEEFDIILDRFRKKNVTYWHDVGHAYISEKLGFIRVGSLLKKFGAHLYGAHLHNIKNLVDHQAPIAGDFDFRKLKPYIHDSTIKVIEAHSQADPESITRSVSYLTEVLGD